jgi:hypothetical protein
MLMFQGRTGKNGLTDFQSRLDKLQQPDFILCVGARVQVQLQPKHNFCHIPQMRIHGLSRTKWVLDKPIGN